MSRITNYICSLARTYCKECLCDLEFDSVPHIYWRGASLIHFVYRAAVKFKLLIHFIVGCQLMKYDFARLKN